MPATGTEMSAPGVPAAGEAHIKHCGRPRLMNSAHHDTTSCTALLQSATQEPTDKLLLMRPFHTSTHTAAPAVCCCGRCLHRSAAAGCCSCGCGCRARCFGRQAACTVTAACCCHMLCCRAAKKPAVRDCRRVADMLGLALPKVVAVVLRLYSVRRLPRGCCCCCGCGCGCKCCCCVGGRPSQHSGQLLV